jgi:hypothetical protein
METLIVKYTPPPPPSALDPSNEPAYADRLNRGLVDALIAAGQDTRDGVTIVRADAAAGELMRALAFVVHSSPSLSTPRGARLWSEEFARSLRFEIMACQRAAAAGELGSIINIEDGIGNWPR